MEDDSDVKKLALLGKKNNRDVIAQLSPSDRVAPVLSLQRFRENTELEIRGCFAFV